MSIFNVDNLIQISDGDLSFVREVFETFVSKEEEYTTALNAAIVSNDNEELRQTIHKIKSSASVIGATSLRLALGKIELAIQKNEIDFSLAAKQATELLPELKTTFREAEKEAKNPAYNA